MFRFYLPPALLESFTCHCGNTGVEQTPNKSQHTKLTPEKKILPPILPGFELATFRSRVRRSTSKLSRPPGRCLGISQSPAHPAQRRVLSPIGDKFRSCFSAGIYRWQEDHTRIDSAFVVDVAIQIIMSSWRFQLRIGQL